MNNFKGYLQVLSLLHLALVIGLVLLSVFIYFENDGFTMNTDATEDLYIYVVPIIAIMGYFGSQFLFKKQLQAIKNSDVLKAKLAKYQTASIVKYALLEGPALLALCAFYLTQNTLHFVIALSLIAYLLVQRPNKLRIIAALPLSMEEKNCLIRNENITS